MDNEQYDDPVYINRPYFDFNEAFENYGFDMKSFMENNFSMFISKTYIEDFIAMRKFYILRNYERVRLLAHKFKGSFS